MKLTACAHLANVSLGLATAFHLSATGCAVSLGTGGGQRLIGGFTYVSRSTRPSATVVRQRVLGLDIRLATRDDGIVAGYSDSRVVFPTRAPATHPQLGFRMPMGFAWKEGDVTHELGWIVTRVPEPEEVSLTHHIRLGAAVMASPRCVGVLAGYNSRTCVVAPVDRDGLYVVRYESDKPFDAILWAQIGER